MSRVAIDPAVEVAVRQFVATFVVKPKRERAELMLLHRDREKRVAALQALPEWLDPETSSEVDAPDPRLAGVTGFVIDGGDLRSTTFGAAAAVFAGGFGGLFVASTGRLALHVPEIGAATLCVAR